MCLQQWNPFKKGSLLNKIQTLPSRWTFSVDSWTRGLGIQSTVFMIDMRRPRHWLMFEQSFLCTGLLAEPVCSFPKFEQQLMLWHPNWFVAERFSIQHSGLKSWLLTQLNMPTSLKTVIIMLCLSYLNLLRPPFATFTPPNGSCS